MRLAGGQQMLLAAPSLVETYSVLTRLPSPRRLAPHHALELMNSNYLNHSTVVALTPQQYREFLDSAVSQQVAGGRTYDAIIAATAKLAGADVLLTFNVAHFVGLMDGVEIIIPQ